MLLGALVFSSPTHIGSGDRPSHCGYGWPARNYHHSCSCRRGGDNGDIRWTARSFPRGRLQAHRKATDHFFHSSPRPEHYLLECCDTLLALIVIVSAHQLAERALHGTCRALGAHGRVDHGRGAQALLRIGTQMPFQGSGRDGRPELTYRKQGPLGERQAAGTPRRRVKNTEQAGPGAGAVTGPLTQAVKGDGQEDVAVLYHQE